MQVIRGLHNLRKEHRGCVATIGNFDGVHLGHQAVFRNLRQRAEDLGLPTTVVTFEPQPMEYFAPEAAPARLTRLREKLAALKDAQIERVILLEFGPKLANMEADWFVQKLLIDGLDVRYLFVGDDFKFGKGREGDIDLLRVVGKKRGFEVENMNTFAMDEGRVSSTLIRESLSRGDLEAASQYLGRPYRICGRVAHGDERGRTIGFPTANVNLHRKVSPLRGVFAVKVGGLGEEAIPGVANIGNRPTVRGDMTHLLEVFLFDFNRNIYGEHLDVEFCHKIRDEKKFDNFEQLKHQIELDAVTARKYFHIPLL